MGSVLSVQLSHAQHSAGEQNNPVPCHCSRSAMKASWVSQWAASVDHMGKSKLCWRLFYLVEILSILLNNSHLLLNKIYYKCVLADIGIWKGNSQEKKKFSKELPNYCSFIFLWCCFLQIQSRTGAHNYRLIMGWCCLTVAAFWNLRCT